ncbi:MAG: hypothetical protein J6J43_04645, partial [Oscillospiraceae bacterium]|nr:hypothetical protein [Oscillospiraceae bacterium]
MKKRILSLLLALVMVLSILPAGMFAAAEEAAVTEKTGAVEIDFQASLEKAAQQSFWASLPAVTTQNGADAVRVGRSYPNREPETVSSAYADMNAWLLENEGWAINEDRSDLTAGAGNKVYFSYDRDLDWGLCHNPYFMNFTDNRSDLSLDVMAPAEGLYNLTFGVSLSTSSSKDYATDGMSDAGGSYADILVNGETVYRSLSSVGANAKVVRSVGAVYLEEGVNSIDLRTVGNYWNSTSSTLRSNFSLSSMTLTPLETVKIEQGKKQVINLNNTYLPFDAVVSAETHSAVSDDADIAAGSINEGGSLVVKGVKMGQTEVSVYEGDTLLCTVPIEITERTSPVFVPETIKMDFMQFAAQAKNQSWWNDLEETSVDGIRHFGSRGWSDDMTDTQKAAYNQMQSWLQENTCWSFDNAGGYTATSNLKRVFINTNEQFDYGLRFYGSMIGYGDNRGQLAFIVNVPEEGEGLYNLTLDLLNEALGDADLYKVDGSEGCGHGDIIVNGTKVYENYLFNAPKTSRVVNSMGPVYLKEGANSVIIDSVSDYFGKNTNARRSFNLRSIEFEPLFGLIVEEGSKQIVDLRTTYLAFDEALPEDLHVSSTNEDVLTGDVDLNGNIVVTGHTRGAATLTVYDGDEILCSMDYEVVEKTGLSYDFAKASELTSGGFANVESFEDLNVEDGVYTDLWAFESLSPRSSAKWNTEEDAAQLAGEVGCELSFKLDVTKEGWFSPQLRLYKTALGGEVGVYLSSETEQLYLGSVNTYAASKTLDVQSLRRVQLAEGTYTLTFVLTEGTEFMWSDLAMKKAEKPQLTILAGNVQEKQGRMMETVISGFWSDGMNDDLYMADWMAEASDPEVLDVSIVPGTLTSVPVLQVVGLQPTEGETVTITAYINGVEASTTITATVFAHVALETFDVNISCVDQGIIARNTNQKLVYEMTGVDGDVILPGEAHITYEISNPAVLTVDEEDHTLRGIANGEASVTITAQAGGVSFTKTLDVTVADVGENRLDDESSHYSGGTIGNLTGSKGYDTANAMAWTDVADDGTGNYAIRVVANSELSYNEAANSGELALKNGKLAAIQGGQLYEMSFKMKTEGYVKPADATADWRFTFQLYDYWENARSTVMPKEYTTSLIVNPAEMTDEWTTYTLRVRAPIDTEEVLYVTPRITYGPFVGYYPQDKTVSGWQGTFWIDDIEIREVSFDHVDMELQAPLLAIGRDVSVKVTPMTVTGNPIIFDDEAFPTTLNTWSTNEDVISVGQTVTPLYVGDYFHNDDYMTIKTRLVGLNDKAQIVAEVQVNDEIRQGKLDVDITTMPDELRDVTFTLNDAPSLALELGDKADAAVSARTTQLTPLSEEEIRANGSIYFTSSNTDVVVVDTVTGEVTCVGEGESVITAYVCMDGVIKTDTVVVTGIDETDLASIRIEAPVTYVGVGNALQLAVTGLKNSGAAADMTQYPVTWSVDEEAELAGIASIHENGKLRAYKEGTVTVTATIGVQRTVISDLVQITVVPNEELAGDNIFYELIYGHGIGIESYSVEENGIAVNWDETHNGGAGLKLTSAGIDMSVPVGKSIVLDFMVHKDGWYQVEARGASRTSGAAACNIFVDDAYVGDIEFFGQGGHYGRRGGYNTVWLEAGVHSITFTSYKAGVQYIGGLRLYAASDPNEVELSMTADNTDLVISQTSNLSLQLQPANGKEFSILQQTEKPEFTNHYILTSSDPNVVQVDGMTVTAKGVGTATVTLTGEIDYKPVTAQVTYTVKDANIASAELTAENTAVKPGSEPAPLTLTLYGVDGAAMTELPEGAVVSYTSSEPSVVSVDAQGIMTIGKVGSALVTASVTESGHTVEASLWITVTEGKTEPTVYTYEERATAQENVLKYSWAWEMKETAVNLADVFVENLDYIYSEMLFVQTWPGNTSSTGYQNDSQGKICRYCKTNLETKYGHHPWIVDPINNPWKITCPECMRDFPSNDFGAYFRSGLGEDGNFHEELADKSLLTNDLYPEMGEGWGVDDGWGYKAGTYDVDGSVQDYIFISCYIRGMHGAYGENHINKIFNTLREAYIYTGDEKYGNAGAILIDRFADIYPSYDLSDYAIMTYHDSDGNGGAGRMVGCIWDAIYSKYYAQAYDAFWDCMDNEAVINYLREHASWKGMAPEDITPEYVRANGEENILLELFRAAKANDLNGNFGMEEAGISYAAVALSREPETSQMLEWVYATNETGGSSLNDTAYATGGDVSRTLIEDVSRDGMGNECSTSYNCLWEMYLLDMADALEGVEGYDLWENIQFVNMFSSFMRFTIDGNHAPLVHESSGIYQILGSYANVERMTTAFIKTGSNNVELAKAIYARNGNSTEGLRGDIFTEDPEAGVRDAIQYLVDNNGQWDVSESAMMAGYGIAILREGPEVYVAGSNDAEFSTYHMYYGYTNHAHAQKEVLNMDVTAFGLSLSGNMGYPLHVDSNPERLQWVQNTVSNNTVVVNDYGQLSVEEGGFPLHFADDGYAKVMDAEADHVYEETDIYRRTMVVVDNGDGVNYSVDFFRVLGGSEHVYSFHAASVNDPVVEGLDMTVQPMGTYAGADIPFGDHVISSDASDPAFNVGNGYSWLYNVSRDADPETKFSIDWQVEDFYNHLTTTSGIHLKLHMLSEEPLAEVALADGNPPQDGRNPEHLEFALIRRSGMEGMDTLFTSIIEPYQYNSYIADAELVNMVLTDGTEAVTDRAAAMKITLTSGREDYVIYATNPDCTYVVDDKITFKGFTGVVSYEGSKLTYAWGDEVSLISDSTIGAVVENQPAVTGTVTDFTHDLASNYTMTITMDEPVTADRLIGKYIYVDNDGVENAAYRIHGAEIDGRTAVLDLYTQTLVREYVDKWDLDKGFNHNIAVGQTYSIPLSAAFDMASLVNFTADQVVKAGYRLDLQVGMENADVTYELEGLVKGMKFDTATGKITWTPSKTQVGRYPIAVKAVNEKGDTLATMEFVIYVVSYTGASYDVSVCKHAKAITYEVGGITETVCPACGLITKTGGEEEPEEKPIELIDIAGTNMNLGNELALNFMFPKALDESKSYTAIITQTSQGEVVKTAEIPSTDWESFSNTLYKVTASVRAMEMADELSIEIVDEEGNVYNNAYATSVRAYGMKALAAASSSDEMKTLVVDMLNYGA